MTDLDKLRGTLADHTGVAPERIVISTGEQQVAVRIYAELSGKTRRRACAVMRLLLPAGVGWTIAAGEDDLDLHQ